MSMILALAAFSIAENSSGTPFGPPVFLTIAVTFAASEAKDVDFSGMSHVASHSLWSFTQKGSQKLLTK